MRALISPSITNDRVSDVIADRISFKMLFTLIFEMAIICSNSSFNEVESGLVLHAKKRF